MRVLIVNTLDIHGGAAKAAYRLHKALLARNIDSKMFVQHKGSDDFTVITEKMKINKTLNKFRPFLDSFPVRLYKDKTKAVFSPAWIPSYNIVKKINEINPDIVHLHWINVGMLRIEDLSKIKAPIVWSLHDMWPFTGGCHYNEECKGYEKSCGNCKVLGSNKKYDLSRRIFNRKERTYFKINNMAIIGLSEWIHECAKRSTLLQDKNHINLPNPIDTNIFKPFDKEKARELWNLPKDKKLVLFGAMRATRDPRKGFKELSEALKELELEGIELVVFGSSKPVNPPKLNFKTHYLGKLNDDISLITLYSAVEVMVVPSLQENLSNAIMESLACGTPVVAFDIGGNSDMIDHKKNGYLAEPYNTRDLAYGIEWVLHNDDYKKLYWNAREKVVKKFDSRIVAMEYIKLYENILERAK